MATATLICEQCGISFSLKSSPAIIKRQKFCSKACVFISLKSRTPTMLESFADRLSQRSQKLPDGCVVYTGQNNGSYGQIEYRRRTYLAHRASYLVHKGDIPKGMCVCHSCDVKLCINPEHLWLGTYTDNVRDMISKGRGSTGSHSSITDDQLRSMFERKKRGLTNAAIARKMKLGHAMVSAIFRGDRLRNRTVMLALALPS